MPKTKRIYTKYPGIYYSMGISVYGKPERIYYMRYRRDGKLIEEKAGRQFRNDMTPARAAKMRAARIDGKDPSNETKRKRNREEINKWTLDKLWDSYKISRPDLKGLAQDENRYQKHIKPLFGNMAPSELTPQVVEKLKISLFKNNKAPATIKRILELIRRIVNYGAKQNLNKPLHFTIETPRVNNLKTEDLTPEELIRLLRAIEADSNICAKSIMKLALYTGMRKGEILKLRWDDIDFERNFISLNDPKGGPSQKIPLNDVTRELLMEYPKTESPLVFPGLNGAQRTNVSRQVNKIKKRAGLPKDFRPLHGLRHVYASMLASSGKVDMYTLQKLLTHKSPAMTQRYAHLRDEALKNASNVANDIIQQALKNTDNVINFKKK